MYRFYYCICKHFSFMNIVTCHMLDMFSAIHIHTTFVSVKLSLHLLASVLGRWTTSPIFSLILNTQNPYSLLSLPISLRLKQTQRISPTPKLCPILTPHHSLALVLGTIQGTQGTHHHLSRTMHGCNQARPAHKELPRMQNRMVSLNSQLDGIENHHGNRALDESMRGCID